MCQSEVCRIRMLTRLGGTSDTASSRATESKHSGRRVPVMALPDVCVVYILREGAAGTEVLLGYKRTGLGLGRVVGIGGKVEPGEGILAAAVREVREETELSIAPGDLEPAGVFDYLFPSRPAWSQRSHVFLCRRYRGRPVETEEIVPAWFPVSEIPLDRMWDDTRRWLPQVLRGERAGATYVFGDDLATVASETAGLPGGTTGIR
ncbi:8-oxo-dGTP diphosphatase [Microbacterium caowuchunii]|nr:8-oxo-dGTP diphosphatase [Microbacterium caowuchunii]